MDGVSKVGERLKNKHDDDDDDGVMKIKILLYFSCRQSERQDHVRTDHKAKFQFSCIWTAGTATFSAFVQ